MSDYVSDELGEFYDYFWAETTGYVYLPVEFNGVWTNFMFAWPGHRAAFVQRNF